MNIPLQRNVSLAKYTTLKVGGKADYFVVVSNVTELRTALQFAQQTAVPFFVLGSGSNILVADVGYRGLVIKNNITGQQYNKSDNEVMLTCGAGEILDVVIADTVKKEYWGLENLSAIPGTVGATPVQNVGAYGVEVSSLITKVTALNSKTLVEKNFTQSDCKFTYRDSYFKTDLGREWIITEVTFRLSTVVAPQLSYGGLQYLSNQLSLVPADVRQVVCAIRAKKFPDWQKVGTAGSFFKNPIVSKQDYQALFNQYPELPIFAMDDEMVKVSLGWVLDKICNLKGYCQDGVCLYEKQALVLVNSEANNATAVDIFAQHIVQVVEEKTGLKIEREVRSV